MDKQPSYTAFAGTAGLGSGALVEVAARAKKALDAGSLDPITIFDDATGRPVDIDFRGTVADVRARLAPPETEEPARGPGRPKLGVVAREVTLLPRHWEWLNAQPGGSSVALRKLVEAARHAEGGKDRLRKAQDVSYRVMSAMGGDLPGFEEASRALFAGQREKFNAETASWPVDLRVYLDRLMADAFPS